MKPMHDSSNQRQASDQSGDSPARDLRKVDLFCGATNHVIPSGRADVGLPAAPRRVREHMTKEALHSDRVLLINWQETIDAEDVLRLMEEISRTRMVVGVPLLLILSIDENMAVASASVRAVLVSSLPRILSQCQKFIVALEPATIRHRLLRAFFLAHSVGEGAEPSVQLCDNLSEALEFAQRFAPQEMMELQRALLKHSTQSNRLLS